MDCRRTGRRACQDAEIGAGARSPGALGAENVFDNVKPGRCECAVCGAGDVMDFEIAERGDCLTATGAAGEAQFFDVDFDCFGRAACRRSRPFEMRCGACLNRVARCVCPRGRGSWLEAGCDFRSYGYLYTCGSNDSRRSGACCKCHQGHSRHGHETEDHVWSRPWGLVTGAERPPRRRAGGLLPRRRS